MAELETSGGKSMVVRAGAEAIITRGTTYRP